MLCMAIYIANVYGKPSRSVTHKDIFRLLDYVFIPATQKNLYIQGCSNWGGGRQGGMNLPHFNFQIKQGPTVSVSNIRDIAFYGCSEIIQTRNVTIFSVCATFLGQFTMNFHFF